MIVYYDESIMTYVASLRSYFGLEPYRPGNEKFSKLLEERKPKKVFVVLVDGMGTNLIKRKLPEDSFLRKNLLYETTTVFPPTTTAATTSIQNGRCPNENAWLGWMQYMDELDDVIIPFYGKGYYNDKDYGHDYMYGNVPVKFMDEELREKGFGARVLFPDFRKDGCKDFDTMCRRLIGYSHSDEYAYIYAYWDKYDSYMHSYGPDAKICDAYLEHINYELENLAAKLSNDTLLMIVADHGQVAVDECINLYDDYACYFRHKPSIEARAMAFFIKDGLKEEFEKKFKEEFEERFLLLSHQDILDTHLFGTGQNHERFEDFIGDYLAIAKKGCCLYYNEKGEKSDMLGQHAGMCEDELNVPIIIYMK